MPNLDLKIEGIEKEMSINSQGIITFTLRGGGRVLGLGESTLISAFSSDRRNTNKLVKFLISLGVDVIALAENGIEDKVLALIAYFYAIVTDEQYRTEEAKLANLVFSAIGVRNWGQKVLGWKSPEQTSDSQVLLFLESLTQNMAELRQEINNQNDRINLLLPSHEMLQEITPALLMNDGTVLEVMKSISQNLKDFPTQEHHNISYFLQGRNCRVGERISIGQAVNGCFKGIAGKELPTKYGNNKGGKLYPECAKPIFEIILRSMGK